MSDEDDFDLKPIEEKKRVNYNADLHPLLIESLIQNGLTLTQLSERLGITLSLLRRWKNKYPEVEAAIKKGKEPLDQKVVSSLYRSAMGFTYDEITKEPKQLTLKEIEERKKMLNPPPIPLVETKIVRKHVAPNVIAQIFYLKNRLPDDWKDRTSMDLTGKFEYEVKLPPKPGELKKVGSIKVKKEEKLDKFNKINSDSTSNFMLNSPDKKEEEDD